MRAIKRVGQMDFATKNALLMLLTGCAELLAVQLIDVQSLHGVPKQTEVLEWEQLGE